MLLPSQHHHRQHSKGLGNEKVKDMGTHAVLRADVEIPQDFLRQAQTLLMEPLRDPRILDTLPVPLDLGVGDPLCLDLHRRSLLRLDSSGDVALAGIFVERVRLLVLAVLVLVILLSDGLDGHGLLCQGRRWWCDGVGGLLCGCFGGTRFADPVVEAQRRLSANFLGRRGAAGPSRCWHREGWV